MDHFITGWIFRTKERDTKTISKIMEFLFTKKVTYMIVKSLLNLSFELVKFGVYEDSLLPFYS